MKIVTSVLICSHINTSLFFRIQSYRFLELTRKLHVLYDNSLYKCMNIKNIKLRDQECFLDRLLVKNGLRPRQMKVDLLIGSHQCYNSLLFYYYNYLLFFPAVILIVLSLLQENMFPFFVKASSSITNKRNHVFHKIFFSLKHLQNTLESYSYNIQS